MIIIINFILYFRFKLAAENGKYSHRHYQRIPEFCYFRNVIRTVQKSQWVEQECLNFTQTAAETEKQRRAETPPSFSEFDTTADFVFLLQIREIQESAKFFTKRVYETQRRVYIILKQYELQEALYSNECKSTPIEISGIFQKQRTRRHKKRSADSG